VRKCVSLVAVASAAVGLAACSSPSQHREPAGAAKPVGAAASPESVRAAHAVPAAPIAAAPVVPAASGAVPAHAAAAGAGRNPQPGQAAGQAAGQGAAQGAAHDSASAIGAPVLIPSGTTGAVPQPAHPHAAGGSARPAGASRALAPALPRPAPAPPQSAQGTNIGYDPNAAATSQIMNAVAAAQMDGKTVLLDFGANWCTACRALDKAMHTPKVRSVLQQRYHVVQIDLGNADPAHMALATQYDPLGTFGMPLLVVLNPDGSVRADSARSGQPKYTEADMAAWLNQWAVR